jgi:hypothetical protein
VVPNIVRRTIRRRRFDTLARDPALQVDEVVLLLAAGVTAAAARVYLISY